MNDMTLYGGDSPFDAIRRVRDDGSEFWYARDLQAVMTYTRWESFLTPLNRAMKAAANTGVDVASDFRRSTKISATRPGEDFELSRDAAYLVALNGDPNKPEVASAQAYFVAKTKEAEARPAPAALPEDYETALEHLLAKVRENRALTGRVAELEPSAHAWDTLADTGADYSAREAAFVLNRDPSISTGQNRLMDLLRQWGLIGLDGRPYASHAAHVTLRPQTRWDVERQERVSARPQVRITVAGLRYLHKRLGGSQPLDLAKDVA